MDNYGFESKYSAQQIESMLDRMSCLPSYGLVKLDSSKQFPVDLCTIYDDFELNPDTGIYQIAYIKKSCLPLDLQKEDLDMSMVMLYNQNGVRYQQLFIAGTIYLRHFIAEEDGTGSWSEWTNLIVGALSDEKIKVALGYEPADNDDVLALQGIIDEILERLDALQAKSDNNFNAIKFPLKNNFDIEKWFTDKVTILRIHVITYSKVSMNTKVTITNIATDEKMYIQNLVPHSAYIYDLDDMVPNLIVTIENAEESNADVIIEYMGPQDEKYGDLKCNPNCTCDGNGSDGCNCNKPKPNPDDPDRPYILLRPSELDIKVKNAITMPVDLQSEKYRY